MSERRVQRRAVFGVVLAVLALGGHARPASAGVCYDIPPTELPPRTTGTPLLLSGAFPKFNPFAVPVFQVQNGLLDGEDRCSSATITLNGSTIFGPSDFNQQVGFLSKPVVLQSENSATLDLKSAPGCQITVSILDLDHTPPVVNLVSPTEGQLICPGQALTVQGTIDDPGATVTANGVPCSVEGPIGGASFSCSGVVLPAGQNNIQVTATDWCNNVSTVSRTVLIDTTPPVLAVDGAPEFLFCSDSIHFSGSVTDVVPTRVSIGPYGADVVGGRFLIQATGIPELVAHGAPIVAVDACGLASMVPVNITVSPNAPLVGWTALATGALLCDQPTGGWGTIQDASLVSATVNGQAALLSQFGPASFSFAAPEVLQEGPNSLQLTAQDACGRQTTSSTNVVLDAQGPQISLDSSSDFLACTSNAVVSGSISDGAPLVVLQVGWEALPPSVGPFSVTFTLGDGRYYGQAVYAQDLCWRSAVKFYNLVVDSQPPVASLIYPSAGQTLCSDPASFSWYVVDTTPVTVTVGNVSQTFPYPNAQISVPGLPQGEQQVLASFMDQCGHSFSEVVPFFVDTVPPTVSILSPTQGQRLCSSPIQVTGAYTNFVANLLVNGTTAQFGNGVFQASVPVSTAQPTIQAVAYDACNRQAASAVSISFVAPALTITSPPLPFVRASTVVIQGTVADPSANVSVQYSVNGTLEGSVPATVGPDGAWTVDWTLPQEGAYSYQVVAQNSCGSAQTGPFTFTYDVSPPALQVVYAPQEGMFYGTMIQSGTALGININAIDTGSGVASGTALIDGAAFPTIFQPVRFATSPSTIAYWNLTGSLPYLSEGYHVLFVSFIDNVGNVATYSATFAFDQTPPQAQLSFNTEGHQIFVTFSDNFSGVATNTGATAIYLNFTSQYGAPGFSIAATGMAMDGLPTLACTIVKALVYDNAANVTEVGATPESSSFNPVVRLFGVPTTHICSMSDQEMNATISDFLTNAVQPDPLTITYNGQSFLLGASTPVYFGPDVIAQFTADKTILVADVLGQLQKECIDGLFQATPLYSFGSGPDPVWEPYTYQQRHDWALEFLSQIPALSRVFQNGAFQLHSLPALVFTYNSPGNPWSTAPDPAFNGRSELDVMRGFGAWLQSEYIHFTSTLGMDTDFSTVIDPNFIKSRSQNPAMALLNAMTAAPRQRSAW